MICATSLSCDENGYYVKDVPERSVTRLAAQLVPSARVVGALQQFMPEHLELARLGLLESDAPITGTDREATDLVEALVDEVPGLHSLYMGGLDVSAAVKGLAAVVREVSSSQPAPVGCRVSEKGGGLRFLP